MKPAKSKEAQQSSRSVSSHAPVCCSSPAFCAHHAVMSVHNEFVCCSSPATHTSISLRNTQVFEPAQHTPMSLRAHAYEPASTRVPALRACGRAQHAITSVLNRCFVAVVCVCCSSPASTHACV